MAYKPRSGAFRKVKYPIKIYKETEIPARELKDVLEMADKIKIEETVDCNRHQVEVKNNIKENRKSKSIPNEDIKKSNADGMEFEPESCGVKDRLPKVEFSVVPDNVYNQIYREYDSMPAFPVKSCADSHFSSDSDAGNNDSEYDMDSEDECWLNSNPQFHITASRLEYIFAKLNKRNTHVPHKAVGALPPALHSDFRNIFPYWKLKRLNNRNTSIFKSNILPDCTLKKDVKLASGYVPTDPSIAFAGKVRKSIRQQSPAALNILPKCDRLKQALSFYDRMMEFKMKLLRFRVLAQNSIQEGLNHRDVIKDKMSAFALGHCHVKVHSPESEELDQEAPSVTRNTRRRTKSPSSFTPVDVVLRSPGRSSTNNSMRTLPELEASSCKVELGSTAKPKQVQPLIFSHTAEKEMSLKRKHEQSSKTPMEEHSDGDENKYRFRTSGINLGGRRRLCLIRGIQREP